MARSKPGVRQKIIDLFADLTVAEMEDLVEDLMELLRFSSRRDAKLSKSEEPTNGQN